MKCWDANTVKIKNILWFNEGFDVRTYTVKSTHDMLLYLQSYWNKSEWDWKLNQALGILLTKEGSFFGKKAAVLGKKSWSDFKKEIEKEFQTTLFSGITIIFFSSLSFIILGVFIPLYDIYMHVVYGNVVKADTLF